MMVRPLKAAKWRLILCLFISFSNSAFRALDPESRYQQMLNLQPTSFVKTFIPNLKIMIVAKGVAQQAPGSSIMPVVLRPSFLLLFSTFLRALWERGPPQ